MKKFLALVLALVMTFSLVTISAGAEDFTDDASINYEEAVDVMTALEIVGGYADGSFNPNGTLTRGAAAKIICNMILGPTAAGALATVEAPFKDVPADHVFSGYIAYCVSEGIVSGYTDGTFRPAGTLTGYAFMKMLLGALGYDAATEGYVGANFAVNVAKRALNIGLDKGLDGDFVGSKPLTREEACLYAFNALKADMVEYDNNQSIKIGDVVISNSSKAEAVTSAKDSNTIVDETVGSATASSPDVVQFAEKYFPGLTNNATTMDDLGRPAHGWQITKDGKITDIGDYASDATLTFTAAVEADDMTTALKGYTYAGTVNTYVNDNDGWVSAVTSNDTAAEIATLTGNGKTVEIYVSNNAIGTIVVIEPKLGEVTGVTKTTENKSHGAYTTYTIDTSAASGKVYSTVVNENTDKDTAVLSGEVAKKDMVTYYKSKDAAKVYIDNTTSMSGLLTAANSKGELTIDGAVYEMSEVVGATLPSVTKKTQDFYVDSLGYVIKSYTSTTTNYAYVPNFAAKTVMVANNDGTYETGYKATIVLADGTVETVITSASWAGYEGKIVTYTINNKDQYHFESLGGTAVSDLADDDTQLASGLKANSATLYVVCNYIDDDEDGTKDTFSDVTLYTGYKAAPVYLSLSQAEAVDTDTTADSIANVMFIGDVGASASETGKYVYVKGTWTKDTTGYIWDTITAGEDTTSTKATSYALSADTLYSAIGTAVVASADGTTVQNKGGLLYINDTFAYTVADDVAVYTINMADDSVSVGTAADLTTKVDTNPASVAAGTRGVYVETDTGATKATTIYILFNSED